MSNHDEPNCFCCPEPVKLGIKHRLSIHVNDHEDEDLCVLMFHYVSWEMIHSTAYFIFQQKVWLLGS